MHYQTAKSNRISDSSGDSATKENVANVPLVISASDVLPVIEVKIIPDSSLSMQVTVTSVAFLFL